MKATRGKQLTRRSVLWHLLGTGMYLPFATGLLGSSPKQEERHAVPARPPSRTSLSPEDDQFLDELERWFASGSIARGHEGIVLGDLNIAPLEHDVWSHKDLLKVVSHTPVERRNGSELLSPREAEA